MKNIQNIFRLIIAIGLTFYYVESNAQSLGLNNATPDASSILDLTAIDRGLLVPRMTTLERTGIALPADGLLVYDLDLDGFYYWDATAVASWRPILSNSKSAAASIAGWLVGGNAPGAASILGTTDNSSMTIQTGTGALNIGTDAFAKTITLGNITGATALNFNTGTAGTTHTTTDGIYTLNTGTGAINLGTDAFAKTITLGNITGATALNFNTGTAGTTHTTTNGIYTLRTGTGAISLGTDAVAKTITLGNITGATAVNINTGTAGTTHTTTNGIYSLYTGTGSISLGTDAVAKTIALGNATGATAVNVNTGTGGTAYAIPAGSVTGFTLTTNTSPINIGADPFAKTITIGNITGATATYLRSGTGGMFINDATGANTPLMIGTGTTTGQVNIGNATGRVTIGSTAAPDASAIVDIPSTVAGILIPRMDDAAMTALTATAVNGLLIFNTTQKTFYYYDTPGLAWRAIYSAALVPGGTAWWLGGNATAGESFGTTNPQDLVFITNNTERLRIYNGNGLAIAALSTATSTALDIGALSGATANTGINVGAISGTGTASAFTTAAISATVATAYHLNLGSITGANATSHTGINLGNISGATLNAYGINLGTLTGGTTANYGINTGAITSTGATNSYGLNIGAISGSGTNTYGINVNALTSTGVSTGINVAGLSGAGTTNTGLLVNTISGGTVNNFGLRISGTAAAATNYGIYIDAPAQNYFAGQVGSGTTAPTAGRALDVRGTIIGALPIVAISHDPDDRDNGDDDFFALMVASVPSTNSIYVRATTSSTINDNALDATGNWSGWVDFGQPSGAAGPPYIMSISVSAVQVQDDANDCHAVISVRMSDGTVYVRTTTADNTAAADMDDTAFWEGWTNFGGPGM